MHRSLLVFLAVLLAPCASLSAQSIAIAPQNTSQGPALYSIDDDHIQNDPHAAGHGNFTVEVGETFSFWVAFHNSGDPTTGKVLATLRIKDPAAHSWAKVLESQRVVRALETQESDGIQSWPVQIDATAPAPCTLPLEFTLTDEGKSITPQPLSLDLPILRPPDMKVDIRMPEAWIAGQIGVITLTKDDPAKEFSRFDLFAELLDFDVEIHPPSGNLCLRPYDWTVSVRKLLAHRTARVLFRGTLQLRNGNFYSYWKELALPLQPAGKQASLTLAAAPGLDPASVFVDQFDSPVFLPGVARAAPFACTLDVPERPYAIRVVPHAPAGVAPPAFAVTQGAWPGAPLAPGAAVIPDARPLAFGWTGVAPADWSVWVRVRAEEIVFELHRAPPGMIFVPAGTFAMNHRDWGRFKQLEPGRPIKLSAYAIDAFETTCGQYAAFLADPRTKAHAFCNPDEGPNKDHTPLGWDPARPELPVVGVDWFDAAAFAAWAGKRLPTEAEWERFATGPSLRSFPWGAELETNLCNADRRDLGPMRVGQAFTDRSEEGGYDLGGNVAEWVSNWQERDYWQTGPDTDPPGPKGGEAKVIRGASWFGSDYAARCACGQSSDPRERLPYVGFRCARDAGK